MNNDLAHQALDILRNRLTIGDLDRLSEAERRQFVEILHHWAVLAQPEPRVLRFAPEQDVQP